MAAIHEKAYLGGRIVPISEAQLNIASSAVLYGLSVYTVFPICRTAKGYAAFRLHEHIERLQNSAKIIGMDAHTVADEKQFLTIVRDLVKANDIKGDVFARATIHVTELLPGTRSRGLKTDLSVFLYEAAPIVPQDGMRLKTSVWRRVPDYAIPSRAKVNGAYVNSVLARQDAIDSGYDDCIFLDAAGHVCEASAANICIVRDGVIITSDSAHDILEGINRRTVLELAHQMGIPFHERSVDLTELYIADEVFMCGTSAFVAPVKEVDARMIGAGVPGKITSSCVKNTTMFFTERVISNAPGSPLYEKRRSHLRRSQC